jgi:DNA-binding IclR family transcriptional regulator
VIKVGSLEVIRDQGYAIGLQECMAMWNTCAAPIMWNDRIVGSVLLLKPAAAMHYPAPSVIEATKTTAAKLSGISSDPWPAVC